MSVNLPALFIGSSSEGNRIAREVELQLKDYVKVNLWSNEIFSLGKGTLEALINALDNFDFAVMVLTPDDLIETRNQNYTSPRDNVLFELGLFMGRLGRDRTFILTEEGRDMKIPSDLAGIVRATFKKDNHSTLSSSISPACTQMIQQIESLGKLKRIDANENDRFNTMADQISAYISDKKFENGMMSFEKIREYINKNYTDESLCKMIENFPKRFRRSVLKKDRQGLKML